MRYTGGKAPYLFALLGLILLLQFVWIPAFQQIQESRKRLEQGQLTLESRMRSVTNLAQELETQQDKLYPAWDWIQTQTYGSISPLSAGTDVLERIQSYAIQTGVQLTSTTLRPREEFGAFHRIRLDLRGVVGVHSLFHFLALLTQTEPAHQIERFRIDVRPNHEIQFDIRLAALVMLVGSEDAERVYSAIPAFASRQQQWTDVTLFGLPLVEPIVEIQEASVLEPALTYTSAWQVMGLIYHPEQATALLRHGVSSQQEFVQMGDYLGLEQVVEITPNFIRLRYEQADAILVIP